MWGVLDRLANVEVIWNRRLRTTAGRAHLRELTIQLNPRLLARVPYRIDEVLAHEAAHLAVGLVHGTTVPHHGPEWSAWMVEVGHDPNAKHDFPVEGLLVSRSYFLHVCTGCGERRITSRSRVPRECGCARHKVQTYRAPRTAAGLRALEEWTVAARAKMARSP